MRREKEVFAREVRRIIAESPWTPYHVALRGCFTPQILSKIMTNNPKPRRGATEAQVFQIAAGVWCDDCELEPLQELLDERTRGPVTSLGRLFDRHNVTPDQIALETCIAIGTVRRFVDGALCPDDDDELVRMFVATVVRDKRRTKVNALLEAAGYYQLLPPLPPLRPAV